MKIVSMLNTEKNDTAIYKSIPDKIYRLSEYNNSLHLEMTFW